MDLSLNDTQQLIQDSARDFVRGACDRDMLLKVDRDPTAMHGFGARCRSLAGAAWRSRNNTAAPAIP